MTVFSYVLRIPEFLYRIYMKHLLGTNYFPYIDKPLHLYGQRYIHVGERFSTGVNVTIEAYRTYGDNENYDAEIFIGDNVTLGEGTHISAINKMKIGNGVLTGRYVSIIDNNHGESVSRKELEMEPIKRPLSSKGPIIIGNNVWIGDKVSILGGVSIGDAAVIGANAVVTIDVPPYSIVAGNPARIIRRI